MRAPRHSDELLDNAVGMSQADHRRSLSASCAVPAPFMTSQPLLPQRLIRSQVEAARGLTGDLLKDLIQFRTTHDLLDHVRDEGIVNYTDLEIRLHENYPIRATAVEATRSNLNARRVDVGLGGFLHDEMPLAPETISERLWMYPMEAASAAYAFAQFEMYGEHLAEVLRGAPLGVSFHRGVNDWQDLSDSAKMNAARKSFSSDMNVPASRVSERFLTELQALKSQRNRIVHEGRHSGRFESFYKALLRLVCRLHFIAVPGDDFVVVCPWPDHDQSVRRPRGQGIFSTTRG